jgi:hypothetical protein
MPYHTTCKPAGRVVETLESLADGVELVFCAQGAGCSFPPLRWGVKLPSGFTHWFETELKARNSQYWPHCREVTYLRAGTFDARTGEKTR